MLHVLPMLAQVVGVPVSTEITRTAAIRISARTMASRRYLKHSTLHRKAGIMDQAG